eukprot:1005766-Pleurochrysis_carterae.AAC.1
MKCTACGGVAGCVQTRGDARVRKRRAALIFWRAVARGLHDARARQACGAAEELRMMHQRA